MLREAAAMTVLPLTEELRRVVDEAYAAFAPYTIGSALIVCHCPVCMTPEVERDLVRTPLREIPSALLAEYTNSAHAWDNQVAREMRYFLPRYFELIAANDAPCSMGTEICLRRLRYADWRTSWPPAEVDLIERYFDALVRGALERLPMRRWDTGVDLAMNFGDILTMIVTSGGDLDRALAVWDAGPEIGAAVHMAQIRTDVYYTGGRDTYRNAHLDDHPDQADKIAAFVNRPGVSERIEAAFFLTDDPDLQTILSRSA
jgi:hypothetical protein